MASFLVTDSGTYLWLIKSARAQFFTFDIIRQQLSKQVRALRRILDPIRAQQRVRAHPPGTVHKLYSTLFGPAVGTIAGLNHLIIILDGPLAKSAVQRVDLRAKWPRFTHH